MTHSSTGVDEVWGWLYQPLQNLKAGQGEAWRSGREHFLAELGLANPGGHPVVEALLYRLDKLPAEERDGLLAGDELETVAYQVVHEYTPAGAEEPVADEPPPEPAVEDTPGYDERVWAEYLHANLGQWDGTAESWPLFAEWFTYHGAEAGVSAPATALIEYFTTLDNSQRINGFADYGIVITPPAALLSEAPAEPVVEPVAEPPAATDEEDGEDEDWDGEDGQAPEFDEHGERLLAEIMSEHPEFAELSEAERRLLLAEVLSEESV
jgi:hypothetical protein